MELYFTRNTSAPETNKMNGIISPHKELSRFPRLYRAQKQISRNRSQGNETSTAKNVCNNFFLTNHLIIIHYYSKYKTSN